MSRTRRIKNNFRVYTSSSFNPRSIPSNLDWTYDWVDGEKIGEDKDYMYLIKVADNSKEGKWNYEKWAHADGRAFSRYGGKCKGWVHCMVNRKERHNAKRALHRLPIDGDAVIACYNGRIPLIYY